MITAITTVLVLKPSAAQSLCWISPTASRWMAGTINLPSQHLISQCRTKVIAHYCYCNHIQRTQSRKDTSTAGIMHYVSLFFFLKMPFYGSCCSWSHYYAFLTAGVAAVIDIKHGEFSLLHLCKHHSCSTVYHKGGITESRKYTSC